MDLTINVLDHGYVKLCETWGHGGDASGDLEAGVISAARQSTQGGFRGWDEDAKLLRYLYEHKHLTPFEFAGMVIEVQAPIFVFREWHRHRTQSFNEASARYAPLPELYYQPRFDNVLERSTMPSSTGNKQAASVGPAATATIVGDWLDQVEVAYVELERLYQQGLAAGIPKELARIVMPVGHYSRMRASANLRNWLAFMTLRCDPAAQWEIRQFADAVSKLVEKTFPHTWVLWCEEFTRV
jgi:thymidylate synthase (FAD)